MPRYRLTIAYDGTDFHGWQRQEPADAPPLRTVQGVVQEAVADLIGVRVDVVGASRTDSGVHAVGQVAAFTADVRVPIARLAAAITARLPRDVQVLRAEETHDGFNPIGDARSKCYRYSVEHTSHPHHPRPLFDRNLVFATPYALDVSRMRRAAAHLVGTYDCVAFAQINHGRSTTVRTIYDCTVHERANRRVEIEIVGGGAVQSSGPVDLAGPNSRRVQSFVVPASADVIRLKLLRNDGTVRYEAAVHRAQLGNLPSPEGSGQGARYTFDLQRYPAS